jgi:hypothetical protein
MRKVLLALLMVCAAACAGNAPSDADSTSKSASESASWQSVTVLTAKGKLGGCVVADVDPRHKGNEIVAVSGVGEVYVARKSGAGWAHDLVAELPGEMIQVAVGDVRPERTGLEIVAVGMAEGDEGSGGSGATYVLSRQGDGWESERVLTDSALVHGVAVGDLDPTRPGNEILCVGYSNNATLVFREGGAWETEVVATLGSAGKNAIAWKGGAAVGTSGGKILHVLRGRDAFSATTIDTAEGGQSRLGTDGTRLLSARDDGGLGLVEKRMRVDIYKEGAKLRGAVLADLDASVPGVEAATAGYEMKVTLLVRKEGEWSGRTIFEDDARLHHLAAGELLPDSPGLELVTCGYSKKLFVLYRE